MTALEESLAGPKRHRNSCFQCKRRKQKCDRIWPCTPCATRTESMSCSFSGTGAASRRSIAKNSKAARKIRRRKLVAAAERASLQTEETSTTAVVQAADEEGRLDGGHGPNVDGECHGQDISRSTTTVQPDDSHCPDCQFPEQHPATPESEAEEKLPPFEKRHDDQYSRLASDCEKLREALEALPQKRDRMDALVMSFFQNVNPHYSLIHQAEFAAEYAAWWEKRAKNEPLPVPWTCLLLTLCACACQHLPVDIQEKLEEMFHAKCQDLTEKYHYHARMLYAVIPEGQYYRHNVMWMLHSTYWYKAEAMFTECCHVFITAVREAQELGFNREERGEHLSSFEREMRRRAWCIIDSWDWQIASGLGRDTLIDHSMCNVQRPSLTLELDGQFSPLMHMNMQSDLVHKLAERFHSPAKITTPSEVMEYKEMIDEWMRNFPAIFALESPDTSHDKEQTWIEYHRYYNYTMGFMMLLNPFRAHMKQRFEQDTPEEQLKLRTIAVNLSIRLVKVLDDWVNYLTFRDGRFHFIIFSLVDAATMLADVIRNDKAGTATRRYEMYQTLEKARLLQGKLQCLSQSADKGFRIVSKIFKKLMKEAAEEDYVYLPDGKDDTDQEVLRAAMESISLSAENRIDSGKQRRKAREALTEVYAAKPGLQSLPFSHNDDCHECYEGHGHDGNGALESAHYGIATATLPDYDGQRVPGNYVAASEEHILPTTSTYDLAVPANYIVTAPPIDLATTSSYVEPCRITNYNEPLPLDYVTSAPLTNLATASAYVEPVASDQIFATPPGDVGVAFSNNASIAPIFYGNTLPVGYGAIASSNYDASLPLGFSTTVPPYTNAMLPVYNAFAYLENTEVMAANNITANTPLFSASTAYNNLAAYQMQPFPGFDGTGLGTTYVSYDDSAGPQDLVSSTAPMTHATPATSVSQSSPESYPYSESYVAPSLYNTAAPYSDPTTYVDSATCSISPESNPSSANYDGAGMHGSTTATAVREPYAHLEYSEGTAQQHQHC
ncbi:uncharacterized protein TrAtP1_007299 [Trichoderma atroviride]|uniref:uncharacterized protein n=1 Tax=Hypocrea atroviridis TaxID=63577 RepID=UPI00332B396A|nr:hypothetical protein TrAtP1_007299 [Trichoderma atroviride]